MDVPVAPEQGCGGSFSAARRGFGHHAADRANAVEEVRRIDGQRRGIPWVFPNLGSGSAYGSTMRAISYTVDDRLKGGARQGGPTRSAARAAERVGHQPLRALHTRELRQQALHHLARGGVGGYLGALTLIHDHERDSITLHGGSMHKGAPGSSLAGSVSRSSGVGRVQFWSAPSVPADGQVRSTGRRGEFQ